MILPDIFESKNKMCKLKTSDSRMPIAVMMDVYVMMDESSRVLGPTWNPKTS